MTDQQNTESPFATGDVVRKGNGTTEWRVVGTPRFSTFHNDYLVGLCKNSTTTDPKRFCAFAARTLTLLRSAVTA